MEGKEADCQEVSGYITFHEQLGDNGSILTSELQPKTIGLTLEELESYSNDRFWKPVRTVLFAVFWLSWLLMFAAAIAIIVFSPKCAEKGKSVIFKTQVAYQISLPSFRDSNGDGVGDFNGVTEKLDLLRHERYYS